MTARLGTATHIFNHHPIWAQLEALRIADRANLAHAAKEGAPIAEQVALLEKNTIMGRGREALARVTYAPESYLNKSKLLVQDVEMYLAAKDLLIPYSSNPSTPPDQVPAATQESDIIRLFQKCAVNMAKRAFAALAVPGAHSHKHKETILTLMSVEEMQLITPQDLIPNWSGSADDFNTYLRNVPAQHTRAMKPANDLA